MAALCQGGLGPRTPDTVQPNVPAALAKAGRCWSRNGAATAQLSTHHLSILQVPDVVTHRPPLVLVVDLHSPGAGRVVRITVDQSQTSTSYKVQTAAQRKLHEDHIITRLCVLISYYINIMTYYIHYIFKSNSMVGPPKNTILATSLVNT